MEEKKLIQGLKKADKETLRYVYEKVVPAAINFLRKNIKDESLIDDLILTGIEKLITNAIKDKIIHLNKGIGPYFMGIIKNLQLKYFREIQKSRVVVDEETYNIKSNERDLGSQKDEINQEQFIERSEDVRQALDALNNPDCKTMILKRYRDDADPQELASEYGLSYPAFRKRLSRCMQALREILSTKYKNI